LPAQPSLRMTTSPRPDVAGLYHASTWSISYIVEDPTTKRAAIIDPVLDFDEKSGCVSTQFADEILAEVKKRGLTVDWILDTHPHADHFSAAAYLKEKLDAPTAIGEKIVGVQKLWKDIYNLPDFPADGSQWDRLFADGDTLRVGSLEGRVMFSPGHTLASITYLFGDAAFIHDTMFQPDSGTARADFPGASASQLYDTIQKILALPDDTRLFTGHDYRPGDRPPQWQSTVAQQKKSNIHLKDNPSREAFVKLRADRERNLDNPRLMLHALQVNIRGGRLPEPESNGRRYLKIPIDPQS
jgi:glyoxylase-like metal-dependent hydrolase (beta-lactamase superfamily II)